MAGIGAAALVGASLMAWSPVAAQTAPVGTDTTVSSLGAATGSSADTFSVSVPSILTYYQQHGGARTFGQAVSHDFQLMGRRVQIFENGVVEQRTDGTIRTFDLLGNALPMLHADGKTFPDTDPDLLASDPPLDSPTYQTQALAAIDSGILDSEALDNWNDLPVNFGSTFRGTITCGDLPAIQACDDRRLLVAALDVWGLPTSAPAADPSDSDKVYLRFQRGIMQFSQSSGQTQAIPLGTWFKRVLIGSDVPDDMLQDVVGSRYFAQYAPALSLGVARPSDLPATSLAAAFGSSGTLLSAGLAVGADPSGTPVFALALPTFGTPTIPTVVTTPGQPGTGFTQPGAGFNQPGNAIVPFATASVTPSGTPGTSASPVPGAPLAGTPTGNQVSSGVATPTTPLGPDPCAGDEQILFAPKKPYAGTDVLVAVTSTTHHDVRTVRLTGPIKTGAVNERPGLNGWVWEWTISPTVEGWYEFTFFVDDARPCATSGFNALPAFGATAVPTVPPTLSAFATPTPIPTATPSPTATAVPAPSFASTAPADPASGACAGHLLRLSGENFGTTQAALNGNVLFAGPTGTVVATVLSWTNSTLLVTVPAGSAGGTQQIVVTTMAGASNPLSYLVGGSC